MRFIPAGAGSFRTADAGRQGRVFRSSRAWTAVLAVTSLLLAPLAAILSGSSGAAPMCVALVFGVVLGNTARRRACRQDAPVIRFIASCGYVLSGFPVSFGIAALLIWLLIALVGLTSLAITPFT